MLTRDADHLLTVLQVDGAHPTLGRGEEETELAGCKFQRREYLPREAGSLPLEGISSKRGRPCSYRLTTANQSPLPSFQPIHTDRHSPVSTHSHAADDSRLPHNLVVQVSVTDDDLDVCGDPVTGALLDPRARGVRIVAAWRGSPGGHGAVAHGAWAGTSLEQGEKVGKNERVEEEVGGAGSGHGAACRGEAKHG